jgi:non-ribosomal peptide synthetase component F
VCAVLRGARRALGLRADLPRDGHTFRPGFHNVRLADATGAAAVDLTRRAGATLYMATLAAFAVVLAADAGTDDLLVVTPNALRVRSEWESLVGWFVNRVVVRLGVDDALCFDEFLGRVRAECLQAFAHQSVPFELLRSEVDLPASAVAAHFSLQNAPAGRLGFRGFEISVVDDDSGRQFAPITEVYSPLGTRFESSLVLRQRWRRPDRRPGVRAGLFTPQRAAHWVWAFSAVVDRAGADPGVRLADLRRLAAPEGRSPTTAAWGSAGGTSVPRDEHPTTVCGIGLVSPPPTGLARW